MTLIWFLLLTAPSELTDPDGLFWLLALFAFLSIPDVFAVLLQRSWGRWPQAVFLLMGAVAAVFDLLSTGSAWMPVLGWLVYALVIAVDGLLALSFLLAALLGTPGCEWRALPHLLARFSGEETEFHPCAIYLHRLDRWEAKRGK